MSYQLRSLPLTYSPSDSDASARALIFALKPEWETSDGPLEFVRFKDGITNTVCESNMALSNLGLTIKLAIQSDQTATRILGTTD